MAPVGPQLSFRVGQVLASPLSDLRIEGRRLGPGFDVNHGWIPAASALASHLGQKGSVSLSSRCSSLWMRRTSSGEGSGS